MSNEQLENIFGAEPPKEEVMRAMLAEDKNMIEKIARVRDIQLGQPSKQGELQSRHKIGDTVTITAKVAGIQFSGSKVRYVFDLGETLSIVDSEHVEPAQPATPSSNMKISFDVENHDSRVNVIGAFDRGNDLPLLRVSMSSSNTHAAMFQVLEYFAALVGGAVKNQDNEVVQVKLP